MKNWTNLAEAFQILNTQCNYLVLRNFEDFYDDILLPGHDDIDVLCASKADRKKMVQLMDAVTRVGIDNGIHYKFLYQNTEIALDIRTVGDGYYDKKWQKNMLQNRVLNPKGFYTMNEDDYFHSLIYHAIYQKNELSNDYLTRLRSMRNGYEQKVQEDFEEALYDYMIGNDYYFSMTEDESVIKRFITPKYKNRIKYPFVMKLKHKYPKNKYDWKSLWWDCYHLPNRVFKKIIGEKSYKKLKRLMKKTDKPD